ncbi:MAG: DUF4058 family protein [Fimbriimonadales bacterium]|nr:DUF4058 family protein [Fimbriimonadales bacterium]
MIAISRQELLSFRAEDEESTPSRYNFLVATAKNPFPGMNPYLEDPALWGDVHHTLISAIRRQLNRALPEGYVALIQERVYVEVGDARKHYLPDVAVGRGEPPRVSPDVPSSATAVADAPVHIEILAEPIREPFIEIYSLRDSNRQLACVIEVLSPTNKAPNSEGRRLYLRKQHDLLHSTVHLVEIDLLHDGAHTVFPALEALRRVRLSWDYLICRHRSGWGGAEADVWFVDLPQPLPRIQIPLLAPDPDVEVHLQAALEEAYEEGQYHQVIDYAADCPAPLPPATLDWVYSLLREKGLRS